MGHIEQCPCYERVLYTVVGRKYVWEMQLLAPVCHQVRQTVIYRGFFCYPPSCFFLGPKVEKQHKLLRLRLTVKPRLVQSAPHQPRHHLLRLPSYRARSVRLHLLPNSKLNPDPALPSNHPNRLLRQNLVNKSARPSEVPQNLLRVNRPSESQPLRGHPARTSLQSPRPERPAEAPLCQKRRSRRSPPLNPLFLLR